MTLSPDGKYFAAKPAFSKLIGVYDVDSEKPVTTIPLGSPFTKMVAFAGPNRLIFDDGDHLQIWSIPEVELVNVIDVPSWIEAGSWSLSADGRYFVLVDRSGFKSQANFYDLTDGSEAGVLTLSDKARCQGTAFSQDGKYFAALLDQTWGGGAIQVWDVESGTVLAEHAFDKQLRENIAPHDDYQGRTLEWFPGGSFLLLYGRGVYDVDAGELLSTFPESTHYEIRVIDADRIAVVKQDKLVPYDLKALFERAVANRAVGGTADDANRPPLTKPIRDGIAHHVVADVGTPWQVQPAPGKRLAGLTVQPIGIPAAKSIRQASPKAIPWRPSCIRSPPSIPKSDT